jgi:hypothetical protein
MAGLNNAFAVRLFATSSVEAAEILAQDGLRARSASGPALTFAIAQQSRMAKWLWNFGETSAQSSTGNSHRGQPIVCRGLYASATSKIAPVVAVVSTSTASTTNPAVLFIAVRPVRIDVRVLRAVAASKTGKWEVPIRLLRHLQTCLAVTGSNCACEEAS